MLHRTTGHAFLAIGAFLYVSRFLSAAIAVSGNDGFMGSYFRKALESIGPIPNLLAVACVLTGIVILLRSARTIDGERGDQ